MTATEITKKIAELEKSLFMMNMIDRWTSEDRHRVWEIENEISELEAALA